MARGDDELVEGLAPLPPGRHGFSRDFVAENQRERLLNGVVEAVAEHGYNATTIAQLTSAATVSRRTFYENFSSKEECFLAAYEMIVAHIRDSLVAAAEPEDPWPDRLRAELAVLLEIFAGDPMIARFCAVEPLAAGGDIAARYRASMRCLAQILRPEPTDEPISGSSAEAREQALVGGIATLIVRRLSAGQGERLDELLPDLFELILTPYLGRDEAQRLAHGHAPSTSKPPAPTPSRQLPDAKR
jgi:AcrR family transcriptional regulator